jgi:hypothetical protein
MMAADCTRITGDGDQKRSAMARGDGTRALFVDSGGPMLQWDSPEAEGPRTGVLFETRFCDNPECRFAHLRVAAVDEGWLEEVDFTPENAPVSAPGPTVSASVNVDTGEIQVMERRGEARATAELVAKVEARVQEDGFLALLRRRFRSAKAIERDQWRERDWSWWTPGTLVSWCDVFEDDPQFLFRLDGETYWAEDAYCVTPGCRCRDVCFVFYRLKSGGKSEESVMVDLRTWRATGPDDRKPLNETQRRFWGALKGSVEGLKQESARRHRELSKLGPEILRLSGHDAASRAVTERGLRRNDPCPCGSGRKYKKCCLGR